MSGHAFVRALSLALAMAAQLIPVVAAAQSADDVSDPYADYALPVVLTPARFKQPLADAPSSVTIITSEMLRNYNIRTVIQAMQLVPGFTVNLADGNDYRVNYHGTNIFAPRRLNVMIDGVTVYQPAFSDVKWETLPVTIEDIERIEVIRGSHSATYGPNSMMAVVNILTKHPADDSRPYVSLDIATDGERRIAGHTGLKLFGADARVTVERYENSGLIPVSNRSMLPSDFWNHRITLMGHKDFDNDTDLSVSLAAWDSKRGTSRVENAQITPAPMSSSGGYLAATLTHHLSDAHALTLRGYVAGNAQKQEWTTIYPRAFFVPELFNLYKANPAYAAAVLKGQRPTGGTAQDDALSSAAIRAIAALGSDATAPVTVNSNHNRSERRIELELQDTYVLSPYIRTVAGLGARHNVGTSETFLGGSVSSTLFWGFGNVEYRFANIYSLNVGAYLEHGQISGTVFSPRVALNAKINEKQSLRFIVSEGARTPDIHELRSNWTYTAQNASVPAVNGMKFYQSAISPGTLNPERIRTVEIGYLAMTPQYGLTFDARFFHERLYDLISEKLSLTTFNPTNNGHVSLSGAEFQFRVNPSPEWSMFADYSYLDNHADPGSFERLQYARHSGTLGMSRLLNQGLRVSAFYTRQHSAAEGMNSVGKLSINFSRSFRIPQGEMNLILGVERRDSQNVLWPAKVAPITSATYMVPERYKFMLGIRADF